MEQVIRWGILGTGKIAQAMAAALREVPGAQLAAVASRSLRAPSVSAHSLASNVAMIPTRRWPTMPVST